MGSARVTRRRLLAGGGVILGLGGLEAASLTGAFDFRRVAPPTAADAWRSSLAALATKGDGAIVHVGHSTHLISVAGTRFLTDPWFHDPAFGAIAHRLGPAVAPAEAGRLDAILVSQVITQRNCHKENGAALVRMREEQGIRDRVILLFGGPRIDNKLARELGFDAGFGPGTLPSEVAAYIVTRLEERETAPVRLVPR